MKIIKKNVRKIFLTLLGLGVFTFNMLYPDMMLVRIILVILFLAIIWLPDKK